MAVKRFKTTYKEIELELLNCFIDDYIQFSTIENTNITNDSFNTLFNSLITKFINKMNELNKPMFAAFGFAQKFVSMSFKYMYCFDQTKRNNFQFCKLPLDKYTINWYRKYGNKELVKQFKDIDYSWSNLNRELYNSIQENIDYILEQGCYYPIKCNDSSNRVFLPKNKIEVEFIVWSQERLNETYKEILKFSRYFDRLGIKIE